MRRICILVLTLLPFISRAQNSLSDKSFFSNEVTGMLNVYGKGIGFDLKGGWYSNSTTVRYLHAEILTLRDPKEVKVLQTNSRAATLYTYNKINKAVPIHFGYGIKKYFANKIYRSSVSMGVNAAGGLSLTALSPVWLNTLVFTPDNPDGVIVPVKATEENYPNQYSILGKASGYGWSDLRFTTGIYSKLGLFVDISDNTYDCWAFEMGFIFDAFPKPLPLLRQDPNRMIYSNFYVGFFYGIKN